MLTRIGILIGILLSGIAMTVSWLQWVGYILIIISGTGLMMLTVGSFFRYYDVTYKGYLEITIKFAFPLWRRVLLLGYMPKLGEVRAAVSYKFADEPAWTFEANGIWSNTNGFLTKVDGTSIKTLKLYKYLPGNPNLLPLGPTLQPPLLGDVKIRVRLIQQVGEKTIATLNIPLTIDSGKLTEKGFVPDAQ